MDEQEKEIEEILRTFDKAPSPSSENSVQNQTEYKRQAQSSKMDIWFENKQECN